MNQREQHGERYWQNWDNGEAAKYIDDYWQASEEDWRRKLACDLKREFGVNASIVEVGCGTGLVYKALLDEGVVTEDSYIGGDVSGKMLGIARRRCPPACFKELDVFHLDLPASSQSNVICIHVLQHLPDYELAVRELLRVAKKKLYIVSWFNQEDEDLIQFSLPSERWDGQQFFNNRYSLRKFVSFIYRNSNEHIEDLRVHDFEGDNYGIAITFRGSAEICQ
jgi:ubiquinone/menaquinone biosynthesis C-methylase UbiE